LKDLEARIREFEERVLPRWTVNFDSLLFDELSLADNLSVLNVLSGMGQEVTELLQRFEEKTSKILAVDPSRDAVEMAAARIGDTVGSKVFFKKENIEKLGFPDASFDLVVANMGIFDMKKHRSLIREILRVTKPGGQFRISFAARHSLLELIQALTLSARRMEDEVFKSRLSSVPDRLPYSGEMDYYLVMAGAKHVEIKQMKFSLDYDKGDEFLTCPIYLWYFKPFILETVRDKKVLAEMEKQVAKRIDRLSGEGHFKIGITAAIASGNREEL